MLNVGREGHVLGHEVFGEVVASGQTQDVAVGDRRVVYPWIGCGECAVASVVKSISVPRVGLCIVAAGGFTHADTPQSACSTKELCRTRWQPPMPVRG